MTGDNDNDALMPSALDIQLSALYEAWAAEPLSSALAAWVERLQSDREVERAS